MKHPIARFTLVLVALAALALPTAAGEASGPEAAAAKAILEASGFKSGLCLHLGCGRDGSAGLTAALTEAGSMPVHGLALDDAALARARAAIEAKSLGGRAMVEKLAGKALPYVPDLATLIVVEDLAALSAAGIGKEEILRVLAPGGALCTLEGGPSAGSGQGKWTATAKPRSKDMDEWTHPHHGPDGNLVSADKTISFPLDFRWIDGVAVNRGGWAECASCRAVVLAGGRCYTVNNDELGSTGTAVLKARDAWSGFPLWKLDCEDGYGKVALDFRNVWPLAADDRRAYVGRKTGLAILDAATGKVEAAATTKFQPRRLVLAEGTVVVGCWEKIENCGAKVGFENDDIRTVWWPGGEGSVEAFEAATGKPKWTLPLAALTLVASDGTLYILTNKGAPPTERTLIGVELATGKEKWRLPHTAFGEEPDTILVSAGPGCAVLTNSKAKGKRGAYVVSAADGKMLCTIPGAVPRDIVGNELWCSDARYDLKTGAKRPGQGLGGTYAGSNVVGGCVPPVVVGGRLVTGSRGGGYSLFGEDPARPPTKLSYMAVRGACLQGMVPANGMFYTAQNMCGCFPMQVGGFIASGPGAGAPPAAADFEKPRPVEKGPAFGAVEAAAAGADDWPTYRHDTERGAGTSAAVPETLKQLWKIQAVKPGEGQFAEAWHARIGVPQPLTAPIVAAGMLVVAGLDAGQVLALKPETGATIWKVSLGGRIDTPPTYHAGLLLVGCHDGWVYALRAKDGAMAYRVRIAPLDRRLCVYGQVESFWPAAGSVLVHDGVAYATAGRSTSSSGGVALVAFKPESGETVWAKHLDEKISGFIDVLSIRDGELAWHSHRLDPKDGKVLPPAQKYNGHVGMLDGAWMGGYGRRSGGGQMLGRMCGSTMSWNKDLVIAPAFAVARAKVETPKPDPKAGPKHPDAFKAEDYTWRTEFEPQTPWARIYSTALTGNSAFFAGSVYNGWQKGRYDGSFVWVKSAATGKKTQDAIKLEAAPVLDGLAVAGGRVFLCQQDGTVVCWGK
ncbi:MAG TPA: PQQ-binding-like beta-propeller repeat protein [Planctomycetota bacterium]|nr:PQQ-binding-like beta-propeller repeat protein [Planctomycetota bacterium]